MKVKRIFIFIILVIAAGTAYTQSLPFLWGNAWGVGARAMSMGNAYTAVADDYTALFYNPAGLGQTFQSLSLFAEGRVYLQEIFQLEGQAAFQQLFFKNRLALHMELEGIAAFYDEYGIWFAEYYMLPLNRFFPVYSETGPFRWSPGPIRYREHRPAPGCRHWSGPSHRLTRPSGRRGCSPW